MFAASWTVIVLTREMNTVAAVWPINALVTAWLVRCTQDERERRLIMVLAAVAIGAVNLLNGSTAIQTGVMVALNLCEITFATWVVGKVGPPIDSLRAFAAFVAGAAIAGPVLTGLAAGVLFALTAHGADPFQVGLRWFYADGLGMMIVGSLALSVRVPRRDEKREAWLQFLAGQTVVLVGAMVIMLRPGTPGLYLIYPFLVVGALSHRELGGVTAVAVTALVVWIATLLGRGPAAVADLASFDRIRLMQSLLAAMVFTVLPISALLRRLDATAAELRQRQERAEELNILKTRLLAYVSHEIRSPLSGVTTLAQLMRDGALGDLTEPQRESLDRIASTGADLYQLARDLTDTAAIQSGKAKVVIGAVGVSAAIFAAVDAASFRMLEYDAEVFGPGPLPEGLRVAADPLRLRQILVNLLVNAAKYGGRPPVVRVAAVVGAASVRFEVSDNGPGIAPERRAALFKDFERLGAEQGDLDGSGLGLSLSHEIARLQHGRLDVVQAEGGGCLFWLELPLWREEAAAA